MEPAKPAHVIASEARARRANGGPKIVKVAPSAVANEVEDPLSWLDLLTGLTIDTQDVLSGAAAHEARRLVAMGGKLPETMIWDVCRRDLHALLGREPTSRQEMLVREITHLYLLDQGELERATQKPLVRG